MDLVVVSIVVIYLGIMLWIGWYSSTKVESNEDFMVAGRRLGPILMAGTLAATEIGGGSSLGVVEKAYGDWGMGASWYIITMGITFIILAFMAGRFRKSNVKTVPEFFRRRYSKAAGLITALIMILPLIGLTATQIIASSTIISVMLNLPFNISVIIVSVVVTTYAIMGGLWSVTLTDFIQVFLIVVGMLIAIPFALGTMGGFDEVMKVVPKESFSLTNSSIDFKTILSLIIMYTASFTVGQEAVSRFYSARDEKAAIVGSLLSALINFIYAFIPTVLGLITLALVTSGKIDGTVIMQEGARYALPFLAMETMPKIIVGLLFAGIISATMSSADSDLLGAGSIFANDIYKIHIKPNAEDKEVLKVTKIVMFIVGVAGMLIALVNASQIITLLMFSFTLRAAGAFFPYVLGHYWAKTSNIATIASLVLGTLVFLLFDRVESLSFFGFDSVVPGLIVSLISLIILTLIFPNEKNTNDLIEEK